MPTVAEVTISLTSHKDEIIKATAEQIVKGLTAMGERGASYAKEDCPVDTGRLRASIAKVPVAEELAVYIGTDVDYGKYVEYDDTKSHQTGKAHFLRDAAANHSDEYREIMKAALSS